MSESLQDGDGRLRPKASIVVRVSGDLHLVEDALKVVSDQEFEQGLEVVIVSHNTDETIPRHLKETLPGVPHKIVNYGPPFSYGGSLNAGIEASSGEYAIILSEHCLPLTKTWLSHMIAALDTVPDLAGVWGPLIFDDKRQTLHSGMELTDLKVFRESPNRGLQNSNSAVRRILWREHPFSETLPGCEDQEWALHFLEKGWKTAMIREAGVLYTIRFSPLGYAKKMYREFGIVSKLVGHPPHIGLREFVLGCVGLTSGILTGRRSARVSLRLAAGLAGGWLANLKSKIF